MKIKLSDHFSYGRLLRFTLPSIAMMIFTSIYGVVDGFFISTFTNKTSFAAVNFIFPFIMMLGAVGFMFGAGGSALVAKTLGEGDRERSNKLFSMIIYLSIIVGAVITVGGILIIRPVATLLGAEGQMLEDCVTYGRIVLISMIPFMLQMEFQSFFITAEKPKLGLFATLAAGVTNMVLDFLFVGVCGFDLVGAACATAISQSIGGFFSLGYFMLPINNSLLRLTRFSFDLRALIKTCTNGCSELMSNISMSLVSMLYNFQLMRIEGEDGVAAYGVLMYVCMIFISIFIGYSIGTAPIVGFNFGAANHVELKSLLKKSVVLIGLTSVAMMLLSLALASPLSHLFVGYDEGLLELTKRGFYIFSASFLFCGIGIFGSSFFTALNNGVISAVISFMRTLVFQTAAVLLLPIFFDIDGVWMSLVVAELLAGIVTVVFVLAYKKKYHY